MITINRLFINWSIQFYVLKLKLVQISTKMNLFYCLTLAYMWWFKGTCTDLTETIYRIWMLWFDKLQGSFIRMVSLHPGYSIRLYWTGWIEIWSGYMIKWGGGGGGGVYDPPEKCFQLHSKLCKVVYKCMKKKVS